MMRKSVIAVAIFAMAGPAAAETVQLYAAGSLKGALTDVAKAYEAMTGNKIDAKYGPSGLLKNEISGGAKAQVFAFANMEHPQALRDEKKSYGPSLRAQQIVRARETRSGGGQRDFARSHARSRGKARHLNTESRPVLGADYGLTVINGAPGSAQKFADFIMSSQGQEILMSYGFASGQ